VKLTRPILSEEKRNGLGSTLWGEIEKEGGGHGKNGKNKQKGTNGSGTWQPKIREDIPEQGEKEEEKKEM